MNDQITRSSKQLGAVLRRRRKAMGLSQGELATKIRIRQATISGLENSTTDTRLETLFDALAALNLELVVRQRTTSSAQDLENIF